MARMQSVQTQCCCCSLSVFSALFGIIMLSTGVCLVLNYRIMEVDTTGLPPQWRNEEGKKIVGIILICCGLAGMGLSGLVTVLYFTVCAYKKTPSSVSPTGQQKTISTVSKPSNNPRPPDPYSTEVPNHKSQSKTSSSRHGKRGKKKRAAPHLKAYKTKLAPHQEDATEYDHRQQFDLNESTRSMDSSQTNSSKATTSSGGDNMAETSLQSLPPPSVLLDPKELPKLPKQTVSLGLPPPGPGAPQDSPRKDGEDSEEEVSQIEEIRKLDKDVANLLV